MSFSSYKTFPELRLKHGTIKEIFDPVTITGNGGREIRRKQNVLPKDMWTIPARNLFQDDVDDIVKFFNTIGTESFLYQDPLMPVLVDYPLTYIGGNHWGIYIDGVKPILNYDTSTINMFNPQWNMGLNIADGKLVLKRNGVVTTASQRWMNRKPSVELGIPASTLQRTCGFTSTSWAPADVITITTPLYKTVRLASQLSTTITAMQRVTQFGPNDCLVEPTVQRISNVVLMEVFEFKDIT